MEPATTAEIYARFAAPLVLLWDIALILFMLLSVAALAGTSRGVTLSLTRATCSIRRRPCPGRRCLEQCSRFSDC